MRPLTRLAAVLLLGAFIGFSTTCSDLGLGGHYHPLATDAPPAVPEVLGTPISAAPTFG